MSDESVSVRDAARLLGISARTVKRLCQDGRLPHFLTPGGHFRFRRSELEAFSQSGNNSAPRAPAPSSVLQNRRERVEELALEAQELRARRDLRKLHGEEQEAEERRKSEAQAAALAQKQELERLRLEAAREAEARREKAREVEARERRRQWEIQWTDYALKQLLPRDAPRSLSLEIHQAVVQALSKLEPHQPQEIIKSLVHAAVDKALEPWRRHKEIERAIEKAGDQIPALARGWSDEPSEWAARASRDAADAISKLEADAPLAKIRAVAIEAGNKVRAEYEAWKAAEDHRQACQNLLNSLDWSLVFGVIPQEREACRRAVKQALDKLPVGCSHAEMQQAHDAALAPYEARGKAARAADRYLQHVGPYVEEIGGEKGEWDLGDFSERFRLVEELKTKLRPALIRRIIEEPFDEAEAEEIVEEFVEDELDLEPIHEEEEAEDEDYED